LSALTFVLIRIAVFLHEFVSGHPCPWSASRIRVFAAGTSYRRGIREL
jgi:hypothetical protein